MTLVYPRRDNHIKDEFFSYYSVKTNFKIKRIWAPDFYFLGQLDKIAVNIKGLISALLLFFYTLTQKADIIYSRDEWPLYFLSFFRKNLVFEAHRFSKHRKFFYKRFKNKNLKIIAISIGLKEDLVKFGIKDSNILVAHDGVDLDDFDIRVSKEEARNKTGLPRDAKIIMYTGHLFPWKGADILGEAAKLLSEIKFIFVGGMDTDTKSFKNKFGQVKNILVLGHKPHKEIAILLKAADVLVLPNSAKEKISAYTSPLKLFEYMASSRPVVASDLLAIREILNNQNSVLVTPDNPEELARGIELILGKSDTGETLAKKAFEDVKNYTWQSRVKKILEFIS